MTHGLVPVTRMLVPAGDYVLQLPRDPSGVDARQRAKTSKTPVLQWLPLAERKDTNPIPIRG
jgi:hypothetical protein